MVLSNLFGIVFDMCSINDVREYIRYILRVEVVR